MSGDEDTELRDLVTLSLEQNGVLPKLKAQLRASVFLALENQEGIQHKSPLVNNNLRDYLATEEGRLGFSIVKEFLSFFKLQYTLSVFEPEINQALEDSIPRDKLLSRLNVDDEDKSVLDLILQRADKLVLSKVPSIEDDSFLSSSNKKEAFSYEETPRSPKQCLDDIESVKEVKSAREEEKSYQYEEDFTASGSVNIAGGVSTPRTPRKIDRSEISEEIEEEDDEDDQLSISDKNVVTMDVTISRLSDNESQLDFTEDLDK